MGRAAEFQIGTKQFLRPYIFRLHSIAIFREPHYYQHISSVLYVVVVVVVVVVIIIIIITTTTIMYLSCSWATC